MVLTKRYLFLCFIFNYIRVICSTPSTNFSFRKTFKSPKDAYDENVAKLDKLEILERSGFSSAESGEKKHAATDSKSESPKAVANALVNLRFAEPETRQKHDVSTHSKYTYPPPHCCHTYPIQYWPPPCCVNPSRTKSEETISSKPCTINIINIFPSPKKVIHEESREPSVYFYKSNKDGSKPSLNDVLKQNVSKLTSEDLAAIESILESGIPTSLTAEASHGNGQSKSLNTPPVRHIIQIPSSDEQKTPAVEEFSKGAYYWNNANLNDPEDAVPSRKLKTTRCPCCSAEYMKVEDYPKHQPIYVVQNEPGHNYQNKGQPDLMPRNTGPIAKTEEQYSRQNHNQPST